MYTTAAAVLAFIAKDAVADSHTYSWTAVTGNWTADSNWDKGSPPQNGGDTVYIENAGTAEITSVISTVGPVRVAFTAGSTGALEITGNGKITTINGFASIGYYENTNGSILIEGLNATFDTSAHLMIVGTLGTGTLTLADRGTVTSTEGVRLGSNIAGNGTLNIGKGSSAGIVNAPSIEGGPGQATVNFNHSEADYFLTQDGTSSGTAVSITGNASVNLIGTGKTTLTGENTYTGVTTISDGTLQIGNGGTTGSISNTDITNNSELIFNRSDALSHSRTISGTGSLTQDGTGTLTLNGANTYTGATTINAGTLAIGDAANPSASIDSDVTVGSGATLRGHGTINGAITNNGSLRPGGSIGTLRVTGNVTFTNGSSFDVDVSPSAASLLDITGSATIDAGATVNVLAESGTYKPTSQYTILRTSTGVSGTFDSVSSNLAFLTPSLSYDSNSVYLSLSRNSTNLTDVATTTNQRSVASALETISASGPSGDMQAQIDTVFGLSAEQARAAYDSLSGVSLNYLHGAQLGFMGGFTDVISSRVDTAAGSGLAWSNLPIQLAAAGTTFSDVAPNYGLRPKPNRDFWIQAYGNDGRADGDANAPGYDLRGGGVAIGHDRSLGNGWRLGAALAYGQQRLSGTGFSGTTDSAALAVYGNYTQGLWSVKLMASLGRARNSSERSIVLGSSQRSASAKFTSTQQSLYAETGYAIKLNDITVQPLAAVSYTRLNNPDYTETGADSLNLNVQAQRRESLRSYLGARLLIRTDALRIEPRVVWTHQFGNVDSAATTASFAGSPATTFQSRGAQTSRNGAQLGLRVSTTHSNDMAFYVDLSSQIDSRSTNNMLVAGLQLAW